jgi:hypothetical protein
MTPEMAWLVAHTGDILTMAVIFFGSWLIWQCAPK